MVTREAIQNFANEIARRYSPEKIILFGSYARGTANEDSDVDLLVVMDFEGRDRDLSFDIRRHIRFSHALDLVIRKSADLQWRLQQKDWFLHDICKEGIVLYKSTSEDELPAAPDDSGAEGSLPLEASSFKPLVYEWIERAESNFKTMKRLRGFSNDGVCLHAFLSSENYLKAFLQQNTIYFPKCHDIAKLFQLTLSIQPKWEAIIETTAFLSNHELDVRDPLACASSQNAGSAIEACEQIRASILQAMPVTKSAESIQSA